MNITFLDSSTLTRGDIDFAPLEALGTFTHHEHTKPAEVIERCRDVEVILTNKVVLDAGTIGSLPSLQLILVCATGVNVVDLEAARERDIPVCNVAGYSTPSVAQHTAALLLALATVASALTPAQIDVLAALGRGKLQELNRRLPLVDRAPAGPNAGPGLQWSSSRRCTRSSMTTAPARSPSTR